MYKMIQIRNVPEPLHRKLKARAAMAGMSLSAYLLETDHGSGVGADTTRNDGTARAAEAGDAERGCRRGTAADA